MEAAAGTKAISVRLPEPLHRAVVLATELTIPRVVRHLVLDTEAVSALLSTSPLNPKRADVITAVAAASGRRVVPSAVRAEAG